jgi:ribonucleoside-diphosphate reductase alpha chain
MSEAGPTRIRKRDGREESFDARKIAAAVKKALCAAGAPEDGVALRVAAAVARAIGPRTPTVEEVQDEVERALMDASPAAAKAYILYRRKRAEVRAAKEILGVRDELKLSVNAAKVLERRYLRKNERGEVVETPSGMMRRVAREVAAVEQRWGGTAAAAEWAVRFEQALRALEFLPNSPTLMNAGTDLGQLAACFVIPVPDSIEGIFDALKQMALVHQSGGGTGFSFSRLRPKNDIVRSTGGIASGPVSFISVFDAATEVIEQGGRRRGANMAILRADHPDILDFITAKGDEARWRNFNVSVAVTDDFMRAVDEGRRVPLVNPRTGQAVREIEARDVFDLIVTMAWKCGDPGLVFIDEINRANPTPALGSFEATNPCGEQPLLPFEACNLGSINLGRMVAPDGRDLDWEKLGRTVDLGVRFLDDVIEACRYPIPEIAEAARRTRKIGLGVMGFADLLIALGVPYTSEAAIELADRIMAFIERRGHAASQALAIERGSFPAFEGSRWRERGVLALRNATVTTIAPAGTISIIAGASSGIEPLYAVAYIRNVLGGEELLELHPAFEAALRARGLFEPALLRRVLREGSVQRIDEIPPELRRVFVTAADVPPEWHVRIQAAFQRYCDNGVSKTVNLPNLATTADVRRVFRLAWELGCKGVTVYRSGSKSEQVLAQPSEREAALLFSGEALRAGGAPEYPVAGPEWAGDCRRCAG